MKYKELANKNTTALETDAAALREEIRDMRVKLRAGQQKDHSKLRKLRKDLARTLTALSSASDSNE